MPEYTIIVHGHPGNFVRVPAEDAERVAEFADYGDLFSHRLSGYPEYWGVSEASTGMRVAQRDGSVCNCPSRDAAIALARDVLALHGKEKFRAVVAEVAAGDGKEALR